MSWEIKVGLQVILEQSDIKPVTYYSHKTLGWPKKFRIQMTLMNYCHNVWFIKTRTTYNLSLWLCEYLWILLLYKHLAYFIQRSWHEKFAIWNEDLPKKSWQRHKDSLCMVRIFMNQTLDFETWWQNGLKVITDLTHFWLNLW